MSSFAVVITACRRPVHTLRAIRAVRIAGYTDEIRLSIDHCQEASDDSLLVLNKTQIDPSLNIAYNDPPRGIWGVRNNHHFALEWGFENADAVLLVEDDALVSPDAVALCEWFLDNHADEYALLSVGHGNAARLAAIEGRELDVIEETTILSPWCSLWTRKTWEAVEPVWNCKAVPPVGWDWSFTFWAAVHRWKLLAPVLSRATNIGSTKGTNGGEAEWRQQFGGLQVSDGTWGDQFQLVRSGELRWKQEWMISELQARGMEIDW